MTTIEEMTIREYKEMVARLQQECKEKSDLIITLGEAFRRIKEKNEQSERQPIFSYPEELKSPVLKIKKVKKNAIIPQYQTLGSSGMDLCAAIDNTIIIPPFQRVFIPTGIAIELPMGYEAQVRPRSGLSSKHGITLINCVGTIDSDYRGEIIVPLINLFDSAYSIQPGERVAQMVISEYEKVVINEVKGLSSSERGEGGFGSTGAV